MSHKCNICGEAFTLSIMLNIHILTHTDARHQEFHICGKVFTHGSNLKAHMLAQKYEKP